MDGIVRKGIAFDPKQLEEFDKLITKKGYSNRSEAIRDLIRDYIVEHKVSNKSYLAIATLTFIYDHHSSDLHKALTAIQHDYDIVKSSLHVHIDHNSCMEVLIIEGKVSDIEALSGKILSTKGVKHGKLVLTDPFNNLV